MSKKNSQGSKKIIKSFQHQKIIDIQFNMKRKLVQGASVSIYRYLHLAPI
jgi:hypothetical protein